MQLAKHKDFESFFYAILPEEQAICSAIRETIRLNFPHLRETWAYGVPYYRGLRRICFLYPASLPYSGISVGVNLGFTRGNLMSNTEGLLEMGHRKEVAYLHLDSPQQVLDYPVLELLHEAVLLDEMKSF